MIGRKKYVLSVILSCCLLVTGCQYGNGKNADGKGEASNGKMQVVTTIFPYYDFARQVAGEYADVTMIVPAGMDTHSFEPTAEDMVTIGEADLMIYNGGELETWVPKVMEAAQNDNLVVDAMIDHVDFDGEVDVDDDIHEEDDHDDLVDDHDGDGHTHDHGDEHIWTSPENAKEIVAQIAKDFGKVDEKHKKEYMKNANKYISEIDKVHEEIENVVRRAPERFLVFADRFPLRNFVEEYDLDYVAAFAGCGSETEPSAETIANLTDLVKEKEIPVILKIELTSSKVADSIAEATGAKVRIFSTCHNVTKEEMEEGVTYVSLMKGNLEVLKEALGE